MKNESLLVVNSKVLPPVFLGVIKAKEYLSSGEAKNTSEAIKLAEISRSAFYKYRDFVFSLEDAKSQTVTLSTVLSDKAGVFSAMTTILYENGANIITVNQGAPTSGRAPATLTVNTENLKVPIEELIETLKNANGIISVKAI